ncbi:MAG TPA: hypothetical protein VG734_16245 [Lacunisphaera sp.]|nr:hypothetical protein [Lacunisphaera sp.]
MNSPRPPPLSLLRWACAGTVLGFALGGCVFVTSVDTGRFPPEWRTQVERPHRAFVDPSGTYADSGQATDANPKKKGAIRAKRSLARYLFQVSERAVPAAEAVRLALAGDKLTVELMDHGQAVWSRELGVRVDAAEGVLVLPRQVKQWTEQGETAHVEQHVRLFRGTDGALYAHVARTVVGVAAVIPVFGTGDGWGRWPSAPAGAPGSP